MGCVCVCVWFPLPSHTLALWCILDTMVFSQIWARVIKHRHIFLICLDFPLFLQTRGSCVWPLLGQMRGSQKLKWLCSHVAAKKYCSHVALPLALQEKGLAQMKKWIQFLLTGGIPVRECIHFWCFAGSCVPSLYLGGEEQLIWEDAT